MLFLLFLSLLPFPTDTITQVCPATSIQPRPATFTPGGIILTSFDSSSIWVYNVDSNVRYPLPDTAPCGENCHLSPDAKWISYLNYEELTYYKMRLDGTQRTPIARAASEVEWWSDDTLLIWRNDQTVRIRPEAGDSQTDEIALHTEGIISIQPGSMWGIRLKQRDEDFIRTFVDLTTIDTASPTFDLGKYQPYFSSLSWSSDGEWLAYTTPVQLDDETLSTELYLLQSGASTPIQPTDLTAQYGTIRINGFTPDNLSWSPDNTHVAFWVIPFDGIDPTTGTDAVLHVVDVRDNSVRSYCAYTTIEHTPNPPRLVWSPDSTHIAFGGNIAGDDKGYLLLALNVEDGTFTELSNGLFPAPGKPDVLAWGLPP